MRVRPGEGEQADAVQFLMQVQPDERANADAPGLGESVDGAPQGIEVEGRPVSSMAGVAEHDL